MSKIATGKIVRYSRDNLPPSETDWAKVKAMTEEEILARALAGPDAQPMRKPMRKPMKKPVPSKRTTAAPQRKRKVR
jgi:hypothetical protein